MSFRIVTSSSQRRTEDDGISKSSVDYLFASRRMPAEGSEFPSGHGDFFTKESGNSSKMKMDDFYSPNSVPSNRGLKHVEAGEQFTHQRRLEYSSPHTYLREKNRGYHSPITDNQPGSAGSRCENGTPPMSDAGRSTPPYIRWAQELSKLLGDKEGVELFERFLTQEGYGSHDLKFWFACQGLKNYDPGSRVITQMIKVIYKRYVKMRLVQLNEGTRQDIADKINCRTEMDQKIFDKAQRELEEETLKPVYLNFLKSDIYLQHIQKFQQDEGLLEDCLEDDNRIGYLIPISSSNNNHLPSKDTVSNFLPPLLEDKELSVGLDPCASSTFAVFSSRDGRRYRIPNTRHSETMRCSPDQFCRRSMSSHLKYSGYHPASAQDSELQSLSSDAQTDDTLSVTTDGSSVDGIPPCNTRSHCKRQQRAMKMNANLNQDPQIHRNFIPRTERIPHERLVEKHPEQFAAILIAKLTKVKREQDGYAKLAESLRQIDVDDGKDKVPARYVSPQQSSTSCSGEILPSALERLTNIPLAVIEENSDSVQSILDQHVSRVWNDSSTCQSPSSKTPPQQSPPYYCPPQSLALNPSVPYNINRNRKERDACSSDSGTVRDFIPENDAEGLPFVTNNHPGHQFRNKTNHYQQSTGGMFQQSLEESLRRSKDVSRRYSGGYKKSVAPATDSSSCVDSGVNGCDPGHTSSLPNHDKVYSWVLENEKFSHGSDSEKESSRHRRSSLSSQAFPSKPSHLKKSSSSNPLDPSGSRSFQDYTSNSNLTAVPPYAIFPQPTQPVAADPSMPLLPPPNTTTQLYEAKRRLENETKAIKSQKPKMFPSISKDKIELPKIRPPSKGDSADDSLRKTGKRMSNNSGSNTLISSNIYPASVSGDVTVIGYCFSGEPVPYRTKVTGHNVTLKQFKALLSKKGNYRYFFKRLSDEFGTGVVNEEVSDDNEILPLWEGKIFCTVETIAE